MLQSQTGAWADLPFKPRLDGDDYSARNDASLPGLQNDIFINGRAQIQTGGTGSMVGGQIKMRAVRESEYFQYGFMQG